MVWCAWGKVGFKSCLGCQSENMYVTCVFVLECQDQIALSFLDLRKLIDVL